MNQFYIYIYLDPRKLGKYCYSDICFLFEPFYVGKGKNERWKDNRGRSKIFKNKINKIKESGLEPIVFKLYENLNENNSFILECQLIKLIGRKQLNNGTLINLTNGGEGGSGLILSDKLKDIRSKKYRKDFSEIKKEFGRRKYILLTEEKDYKNCYTKLEYICPNGHKNNINWNDFRQGHNCNDCYIESHHGENCSNHKLMEKEVIEIWDFLNKKISYRKIGELFNISATAVLMIKSKKTWKNIGEIYENII